VSMRTQNTSLYEGFCFGGDMERDFKGVWIPKEIWLDDRLTALEKVILIEIDSLDTEDKHCYASNSYLAEFCQCTEVKISNAIRKCINLGYLEVVSFDGRTRILKSRLKESLRQTQTKFKADLNKVDTNNKDNNTDNKDKKDRKQTYNTILDEEHIEGKKREAVTEFIKMRKMIRKPLTDHALRLMLRELEKLSDLESEQIAILEQSIANSWQGVFPLRKNGNEPVKHKDYSDIKKEDLEKEWDWEV